MLVDCHSHIQFRAFKDDADDVIQRAREAGVKMVVPSSEMKTAKRGIAYAEKYPFDCWAAVGLHPIHLKPQHVDLKEGEGLSFDTHGSRFHKEKWRLLAEHVRVVAIGEIGLDYVERLRISEEDRKLQEETFRQQIELALSVGKPVIVHSRPGPVYPDDEARAAPTAVGASRATRWWRDSNDDVLRILSEYVPPPRGSGASLAPEGGGQDLRGLMHCYSGNLEQAKRFLDLGFFLSFTGLITFNHSWDEVIRSVPLDRIVTETDAPYLTPVPHRGKRNEPSYVRYVAEHIAGIKGVSFDDAALQTTKNAEKLFGLSGFPLM